MPIFLNTRYVAGDGLNHLLTRARAMLAKALDKALEVYDITHGQGSVLWMLSTGQYATAADLARELDIDAASMTRMIDRLEKRKLMERMQRSDDRRMIKLRLTPAGLALAEKLPAVYAEVMDASLAGFGADELTHLRRLLSKLLANGAG
ncbi:MAG: MarR family transcriptional regulator [Burkholderiaceae bacterium]|nr:MarR family transcriptional regulator [Burkholderiaceae bacterium]